MNPLEFILSIKTQMMELSWVTRMGLAGFGTLGMTFLLFFPFQKWMQRLQFREVVRHDENLGKLNELHAGKKDTITMGGLLILTVSTFNALIWAEWSVYLLCALTVFLGFGLIGFIDDYLKISLRNKKGLDGKFKLLGQVAISVIALIILLSDKQSANHIRELWVPMTEVAFMPRMPLWMTFGLIALVLIATSNTVNLTDGADGLAIGCSISTVSALGLIAVLMGSPVFASDLGLRFTENAAELAIVCVVLLGAGFGFLWFNGHPAKIFMGDTGSLGLGGMIGILAIMLNQPITLILIGGIFVIEGLSVILQVASFQLTGRKIFLISPIHHHFEVAGWPETQVVTRFWILSFVFALLGLWAVVV